MHIFFNKNTYIVFSKLTFLKYVASKKEKERKKMKKSN